MHGALSRQPQGDFREQDDGDQAENQEDVAEIMRVAPSAATKATSQAQLLIIDELGFVPLSTSGTELHFETISQRYELRAIPILSNLSFDEWTETFGSERLTGELHGRLPHHIIILEMNGDSYRFGQSRSRIKSIAE